MKPEMSEEEREMRIIAGKLAASEEGGDKTEFFFSLIGTFALVAIIYFLELLIRG